MGTVRRKSIAGFIALFALAPAAAQVIVPVTIPVQSARPSGCSR